MRLCLPACLPASPLRSALLCSLQSRVKQLTKNTLDYLSLPVHSGPIVVIRIAAVDPLTHTHAPRHARTGLYIYIYICTRTPLWLSCTHIPAGRADARQRSLWSQLIGNRSRPSVRAREKKSNNETRPPFDSEKWREVVISLRPIGVC